ncbi:MAG: NUDIX hydrolase [Chlamydiae bacterium]|nr:NUDIX hydrolase [Chlamydiota bacterium]
MTKLLSKYFFVFALSLAPLAIYTNEQPVREQPAKQPHKPPILTTTAIIEIYEGNEFKGIVLIDRGKAPFGKAIPGGKVEYGETVENGVRREMMEEVNLELNDLRQFHVYSEPTRDFRHHSVEVTHIAKAYQSPTAGDDAAKAYVVKLEDIPWSLLAFDHAQILKDYIEWRNGNYALSMPKP